MLDTLGRAIGRHPWVVILLWIIAVVLAMAAAFGGVFGQPLFARDDRLFDRDSPPSSTQGLADLAAAIPLVSQDRTALLMIVDLKPGLDTEQTNADLAEITARVQQISPNVPGSTALAGGATQILN